MTSTIYDTFNIDTEKYKSILKDVCRHYHTPFSVQVIEGGYYHDDGSWVDENTLLITLIGTPRKIGQTLR